MDAVLLQFLPLFLRFRRLKMPIDDDDVTGDVEVDDKSFDYFAEKIHPKTVHQNSLANYYPVGNLTLHLSTAAAAGLGDNNNCSDLHYFDHFQRLPPICIGVEAGMDEKDDEIVESVSL